jgi:hypothetical protein
VQALNPQQTIEILVAKIASAMSPVVKKLPISDIADRSLSRQKQTSFGRGKNAT